MDMERAPFTSQTGVSLLRRTGFEQNKRAVIVIGWPMSGFVEHRSLASIGANNVTQLHAITVSTVSVCCYFCPYTRQCHRARQLGSTISVQFCQDKKSKSLSLVHDLVGLGTSAP